jgi:acetyl-CoA carboxylase carboxyltransferase component
MKLRAAELSRVRDAHILPDDDRLGRDPLRALRPHERLRLLGDEESLQLIRTGVTSERMGDKAQAGDGVLGGSLRVAGRPLFCFAQDASYAGGSLGAQHADTIVRLQRSMFLTGPAVVREVMGEDLSTHELGGPRVHAGNGVCQFNVATDIDAIFLVRQLLSYLPANAWEAPPVAPTADPTGPDPGRVVPMESRRVYDVRDVIAGIVDGDSLLEASAGWARNLVTAFARIDGRPVGIVANQPRRLGGVIDAEAAQKGARFVHTCNAFGLPLVVLVDTPGLLPGSRQEAAGVIRHGAKLLHAFAGATVPRFTVVLRKAFGGA